MGKDNDIIRHELKENNYWIDNQQGLMKALEEAGNVQVDLEAKVEQLEKALEAQAQKKKAENVQKISNHQQQIPNQMSFKQTNINALFNIRDMTEPQDQGEANTE